MKLHNFDILVLVVYFLSQIGIGLWCARRSRSTSQYFLGDQNFPGWVLGISLIGAAISSITFIAAPADAFKTAWLRFVPNLAYPLVAMVAAIYFVPFFRRGTLVSSYAYLRFRFGDSISIFSSLLFVVTYLVWVSSILYLLAILLQSITGISFEVALLVSGGVTTFYTVKGGYTAVIWTDVIQTFVLLLGAFFCLGVIIHLLPGGLGQIVQVGLESKRLSFWDVDAAGVLQPQPWGFSLSEKTITMLFLAGLTQYMGSMFGQNVVQRVVSAGSLAAARRSILWLGFGCLPVWALFKFLGTALFVFFQEFPHSVAAEVLDGTRKAEEIVPFFIVEFLPHGVIGVVIAGALAAAMSSLSAGINTTSMVFVEDLYRRYWTREAAPQHYRRVALLSSLAVSVLMIGGSWLIHQLNAVTLLDLSMSIMAVLSSGKPAIFLLAMFTTRVHLGALWVSLSLCLLFVIYSTLGTLGILPEPLRLPVNSYYVAIFANLGMMAFALLLSTFWRRPSRNLTNLTVWTQDKTPIH